MALHSFNTEVAQKVGVNAAVVYENIRYWVEKNRANNKHNHGGYYWTYNSMRAFGLMFPYLSAAQVKLALNKLKDQKFIGVSNYNKAKFDKTSWYCDFDPLDLAKIANGEDRNNQPIPDNKPYNKLYILEDRVDTVSTHDTKTKRNENLNLNNTANCDIIPKAKKKRMALPDNWVTSNADEEFALEKGWAVEHISSQAYKFRDYHLAKGSIMSDWSAAWRTWVRNDFDNKKKPPAKSIDMINHIARAR